MPFGLVTQRELDQRAEELRKEFQRAVAFEEEIRYEWASWYDKFRALYQRLLKREKKAAQVDPGATNGEGEVQEYPLPLRRFNRRGF
jgi:hypothetical protein